VQHKVFWALRGVTFAVSHGDVLGVVGRNGSGKSTLLLTLAGVLRPDEGRVRTFGRTTLLTLGAGFESDLSGRENVFLNGALLGFSRRRIEELIDDIHEFSGLGEFFDAPIAAYSTGMRARLGFSIAAHIEPEILLLDEVLGVGDVEFRQRSERKIAELIGKASSIVLVSHHLSFMEEICNRVLWLNEGELVRDGRPSDVLGEYSAFSDRLVAGDSLRSL
jgi:teichoic acid transport system ATP-binding protein